MRLTEPESALFLKNDEPNPVVDGKLPIEHHIKCFTASPVSMCSRLLLLRFNSFKSLMVTNPLGLSCVMLLKARSIFAMCSGISGGTVFSPGRERVKLTYYDYHKYRYNRESWCMYCTLYVPPEI